MIKGNVANGSIIAGKIQYETDGWRPLKLPSGITGQVFFKDNGNGTASLSGAVFTSGKMYANQSFLLLTPPPGYSFVSDNWNANSTAKIYAMPTYAKNGKVYQTNLVNAFPTITKYVSGKIYISTDYAYLGSEQTNAGPVEFIFSDNMTHANMAGTAGPAIVSISHV